jgi:hypothetical protein
MADEISWFQANVAIELQDLLSSHMADSSLANGSSARALEAVKTRSHAPLLVLGYDPVYGFRERRVWTR